MKRFFRLLVRWTMLAAVILVCIAVGLLAYRFTHSYQRADSLDPASLAINAKPESGVTNIALFGLDAADGSNRRADCLMVISIDGDNGEIKLTSLMRDSLVEIEGHGEDKLNHAYAYGGPALAISTINQTFDLDIAHYASVDFSQLANLIGAVGGVKVNVQENEVEELNRFIGEYCRAFGLEECLVQGHGVQMLNGIQAMSYGRIRKNGTGDDWERVERQAIIMEAMFARVQDMSMTEMMELAVTGSKYVTTDLSLQQIAGLAAGAFADGVPEISHSRLPLDSTWEYDGAYIVFDTEDAAEQINTYLYA